MSMASETEVERFNKECPYDYHHFDTDMDRDIYLRNNPDIKVSHNCCGGKGIATLKIYKKIPTKPATKFIPIEGTCDICFLEDRSLYNTCKTCNHPFCKECLVKLTPKLCPCCRGKLENFP